MNDSRLPVELFGAVGNNDDLPVISSSDDFRVSHTTSPESSSLLGANGDCLGASISVDQQEPRDDATNYSIAEGMEFATANEVKAAYQRHAKYAGFSVCVRSNGKDYKNNAHRYYTICCHRAGKPRGKKYSQRIECPAKLTAVKQNTGIWKIRILVSHHNHELIPHMSALMAAHRRIPTKIKRQLEANDIAGLRPSKSIRTLEAQAGGPQNMGCNKRDCRNYIQLRRKIRLGEGDAMAVSKLFSLIHNKDQNFYYAMDLDEEDRLVNVLWVHSRAREAYKEFHDVVTFDTTYMVNKYKMPFGTIVGVDHYGRSILLGCALVSSEDAHTFKWLFQSWLTAMGGVQPKGILTDQCESMKLAIREVMPQTLHRFCLWHILQKVPTKFKDYDDYSDLREEFYNVIYGSLSIELFESNWNNFVVHFGLDEHQWITDLFAIRSEWVPVYMNMHFWGGMLSTQRSEQMHAFFDGYVGPTTTLKQFVEEYEVAYSEKIFQEFEADFVSENRIKSCVSDFEFERPFQRVYTENMYSKVQAEIKRIMYCDVINDESDIHREVESWLADFKVRELAI